MIAAYRSGRLIGARYGRSYTQHTASHHVIKDAVPPKLIPLPLWPEHHPWPPIGGLRWLVFNAETNGFATAFVRVGRRVLIDEAEFFRCVEKANAKPSPHLPKRLPRVVSNSGGDAK